MKIVIELNDQQIAVAKKVMEEVKKEDKWVEDEEDLKPYFYAGNLIGWLADFQGRNQNQNLNLDLKNKVISYVGHRHPLWQDGGAAALFKIMGNTNVREWTIVYYKTSDKRLCWHETLESYVLTRAASQEVIEYARDRYNAKWIFERAKATKDFMRFLDVSEACIQAELYKNERDIVRAMKTILNQ